MQGNVFNVQRFTIHDGPGLRTELFLKGCPLRCEWCSNPESQKKNSEPGVYKTKCISKKKCGLCEKSCEHNALQFYRGKLVSIDRNLCTNCMKCVDACPAEAIKQWGKLMTVEECMNVIIKDRGFYERSGGGVTVSGGEPLLQADFVAELFKACREEKIQTCCESAFYIKWTEIEKLIPLTDIWIVDIKHMNSVKHKEHIGTVNTQILKNIKRLTKYTDDIILRIPIIPGFNDDMENIEATADFILNEMKNKIRTLQLLSFMRLGEEKYQSLGMPYKMENTKVNRRSFQKKIEGLADYFNKRGIHCLVGTKEKQ